MVKHVKDIRMAVILPSNLRIVSISLESCSQETKPSLVVSIKLSLNLIIRRHINASPRMLSRLPTSTMVLEGQLLLFVIVKSTMTPSDPSPYEAPDAPKNHTMINKKREMRKNEIIQELKDKGIVVSDKLKAKEVKKLAKENNIIT